MEKRIDDARRAAGLVALHAAHHRTIVQAAVEVSAALALVPRIEVGAKEQLERQRQMLMDAMGPAALPSMGAMAELRRVCEWHESMSQQFSAIASSVAGIGTALRAIAAVAAQRSRSSIDTENSLALALRSSLGPTMESLRAAVMPELETLLNGSAWVRGSSSTDWDITLAAAHDVGHTLSLVEQRLSQDAQLRAAFELEPERFDELKEKFEANAHGMVEGSAAPPDSETWSQALSLIETDDVLLSSLALGGGMKPANVFGYLKPPRGLEGAAWGLVLAVGALLDALACSGRSANEAADLSDSGDLAGQPRLAHCVGCYLIALRSYRREIERRSRRE